MSAAKNLKIVEQVKNSNLLKGVALQVFEIVCAKPGLTVGEIAVEYADLRDDPTALGRSRNELAKRVSDLVNFGAIKADGKTLCPYTNRNANRYVPTGMLPDRDATALPSLTAAPIQAPTVYRPIALSATTLVVLSATSKSLYNLQFSFWVPRSFKIKFAALKLAIDEVLRATK